MTRRLRRAAITCGLGAAAALAAALGVAGLRVFTTLHRTLEIFYGDRGDPIHAPELGGLVLLALGVALAAGAVALEFAARRAARTLARASLVEALR